MAESVESLSIRTAQMAQILDEYRVTIYTMEQKQALLVKMLEEKGMMAKDEFNKRWPIYLKNDIGILGPDGVMDGSVKITQYGQEGATA